MADLLSGSLSMNGNYIAGSELFCDSEECVVERPIGTEGELLFEAIRC
jgi:hypothetical protein